MQAPPSRAAARRARLLVRLLPLLAVAALIYAGARALGRLSGGGLRGGTLRAAANDAGSSGRPMSAVDLAACMAEPNATAGRFMTTDMYLNGEPTRWIQRLGQYTSGVQ